MNNSVLSFKTPFRVKFFDLKASYQILYDKNEILSFDSGVLKSKNSILKKSISLLESKLIQSEQMINLLKENMK